MTKPYYVYMVRCADDTIYTGITTDVERRLKEHNSSGRGAKYTKARGPVELIYKEEYADRSTASKREHELKSLSRSQKIGLYTKGLVE